MRINTIIKIPQTSQFKDNKLSGSKAKIVGVEPELAGDAHASFRRGHIVEFKLEQTRQTMADGMRATRIGTRNFQHMQAFVDDMLVVTEKEIAKAILAARGDRVTPVSVRRWIEKQERQLEVTHNMMALEKLGSQVTVIGCDVSNNESLQKVMSQIGKTHNNIDLLIHGAGFEESKFIHQKDEHSFGWTFKPKASSLTSLTNMQPICRKTLKLIATPTSGTGIYRLMQMAIRRPYLPLSVVRCERD